MCFIIIYKNHINTYNMITKYPAARCWPCPSDCTTQPATSLLAICPYRPQKSTRSPSHPALILCSPPGWMRPAIPQPPRSPIYPYTSCAANSIMQKLSSHAPQTRLPVSTNGVACSSATSEKQETLSRQETLRSND